MYRRTHSLTHFPPQTSVPEDIESFLVYGHLTSLLSVRLAKWFPNSTVVAVHRR